MADVVNLDKPNVDPEMVDKLRKLARDARAGKIQGFAAVFMDADGVTHTTIHYEDSHALMAGAALLHSAALEFLIE